MVGATSDKEVQMILWETSGLVQPKLGSGVRRVGGPCTVPPQQMRTGTSSCPKSSPQPAEEALMKGGGAYA